jgi:multisubunit Na+/H+ antiporter MnhE subunit
MDFNYITDTSNGVIPGILLTLLGICGGIIIGIVIALLILLLIGLIKKDNDLIGSETGFKIMITLVAVITITSAITLPLTIPIESVTEETKQQQTAEFQQWVSENYLIDLTEKQAEQVIRQQTNNPETIYDNYEEITPTTVTNNYGEKQKIALIKTSDTTWELIVTQIMKPVKQRETTTK